MSERLLLGTRKGMFRAVQDAGGRRIADAWFLGDNVTMVLHDPRDGTLYAALHLGHFGDKLHRSRDDGRTWQEIAVPAYPAVPEGLEDKDLWGRKLEWKLQQIWSLEAGGVDQPGRLWCGTLPGGLFISDDCGDSWRLVESLWRMPDRNKWFGGGYDVPGIHSIHIHPQDSKRVLVGVSCGGVWETRDDGATWEVRSRGMVAEYMPPEQREDPVIQDPHLIAVCRSQPEKLWAQHHNGIFRSTNGGESWSQVRNDSPSSFGFAVAVDPHDGDTAWFAPAIKDEKRIPVGGKLVVTRTQDGGRTFETLSNGLPQEHAYDLIYRHCLSVDSTGHTVAMGSTTGGCWVSGDRGENWSSLPGSLPPIYCVRWK